MNVDLLLPCVCFPVIMRPSNPSQPTDLEAAALYFIRHFQELGGANPVELETVLGLGSAVFQDMLIRMINRGWIKIPHEVPRRLILSEKAKAALDQPAGRERNLSSTEEGKRFLICYDLLGGGFAVIPGQFLSKMMDDAYAVPRQVPGPEGDDAPYGRSLHGFLADDPGARESRDARILQALHADRRAREYLQGGKASPAPHLHVPEWKPNLSHVQFYRCRFEVQSSIENGELEPDEKHPPVLECVEQRNRSVRRLGEFNADRIVDCAVSARGAGDARFLKVLTKHENHRARFSARSSDALQSLMEKLSAPDDDQAFEDIFELWDLAVDRIEMILASRIDFEHSRPVSALEHRGMVRAMTLSARKRIVISSPQIRVRSPELSTEDQAALSVIADRVIRHSDFKVLVHGAKGMTSRGHPVSDEVAIARLLTALGSDQVDVVDRSLDHLRTAFVLTDDDALLWQSGPLFGDLPPRGLFLKLLASQGQGSLRRTGQILPPGLGARIEARRGTAGPPPSQERVEWPPHVAASARDVEDMLARASRSDGSDLNRRATLLDDLGKQVDFLAGWLREESDAAELIVGSTIRDRASVMIGAESDASPLVVGISGEADLRAFADLIDDIGHRLSRQDLLGFGNTPTLICLPEGDEYKSAAERFTAGIGSIENRCELLRQSPRADRTRPTSFIITPTSALLAQEGLVRFAPTAGRKVKGTHLGLHLQGHQARALTLELLQEEWPDCSDRMKTPASVAKRREPAMSSFRRDQLVRRAQEWFEDGNRGAHKAGLAIRLAEGTSIANWAARFGDAQLLGTAAAPEQQNVGYALMKAVAIAEHNNEIDSVGALAELAARAQAEQNLLVTAILADYLPEASIYRMPLTRKLALCVARQLPPSLTAAEQEALQQPSVALRSLACLLMMDGLGGDLPGWLAYIEPDYCDGEDAEFTRALASYARESQPRVLDLSLLESGGNVQRLDDVIERIRQQGVSDRIKKTVRLPPQVENLRDLLFEEAGSFAADLFRFVNQEWETLPEEKRLPALRRFLRRAEADLGVDLYEAGTAGGRSVNVERLAQDYFDRKNEEMQRRTRSAAVLVHRAGRNMITSLRRILALVVREIVPAMVGSASELERALSDSAQRLLAAAAPAGNEEVCALQRLVRNRLRDVNATRLVNSPAWEIPRLANLAQPDWPKLRQAFLSCEFKHGTEFHVVVNWFLEADRAAYRAPPGSDTQGGDVLLLLHDLLESSATDDENRDRENAREALNLRLTEIAAETHKEVTHAAAFAEAVQADTAPLLSAIQATIEALETLRTHLAEEDVESAVMLADDLRKDQREALRKCWRQLSDAVLEDLSKDADERVKPELRRCLSGFTQADTLDQARLYVKLAPAFSVPIQFDQGLQLDVAEGLDPPRDLHSADRLVRLIAAARRAQRNGANDTLNAMGISGAVLGFFSDLDEQQLLPKTTTEGAMIRVSCSHPQITALAFGTSKAVDLLLPLTRDAELDYREKLRAKHTRKMLFGGVGKSNGSTGMLGAVDRGSGPTEVLLSLFFSDAVKDVAVIGWRQLAQLGSLSLRDRRVAILSEMARQIFDGVHELHAWWAQGGFDRNELSRSLLGLPDRIHEDRLSEDDLVACARDLSLIFALFPARSPTMLALGQHAISEIAGVWRDLVQPRGDGTEHDVETLVHVLDRLFETARLQTEAVAKNLSLSRLPV